jgi:predicted porin
VTLFGLVDLGVANTQGGSRVGGNNVTELLDGVAYGPGSRWGLRVSEDLGGGFKANVWLEAGFSADIGAQTQGTSNLGLASRVFGRQSYIALVSPSAGEIRLGRQYMLHDEVLAQTNPFGSTMVLNPGYYPSTGGTNPAARLTKLPMFIDAPRVDNAVHYISPFFGGFRVQAMMAAGEGTVSGASTPPGTIVPRYEGVKGVYANGPLNLGLSYEQNRNGSVSGVHDKVLTVNANYDFGMVKVLGGYQRGRDITIGGMAYAGVPTFSNIVPVNSATAAFELDKLRAYTIGVSAPFGATLVGVNYTQVKYENSASTLDANLGKFGIGAVYQLSKLTALYAAAAFATGDLKDSIQEKRVIQAGLRKAF